jgi:hypothetical protein
MTYYTLATSPTGALTFSPVVSPPATLDAPVYDGGKFYWAGDYSYPNPGTNILINYADVLGEPLSGACDISVQLVNGTWGAWQPYAPGDSFGTAGYSHFCFSLRPTQALQKWSTQFLYVGDKPVGISVDVSKYGPAPQLGVWGNYKIPLSDLGIANAFIYKFAIQDQTGLANNTWYVDNVGFTKS